MNMLAVRGEWTHPFTQATVHNRHHIHQWDSNNPQRRDRANRMRFSLRGLQQDPDDSKANHGAAGITHKDLIATTKRTEVK